VDGVVSISRKKGNYNMNTTSGFFQTFIAYEDFSGEQVL
jgi:hypothetical protein